jgi:hypothetical protein
MAGLCPKTGFFRKKSKMVVNYVFWALLMCITELKFAYYGVVLQKNSPYPAILEYSKGPQELNIC